MDACTESLASTSPIDRLSAVCRERGPNAVSARLEDLQTWLTEDMATLAADLASLSCSGSVARLSAGYQLELGGKRLRPMCVALAARLGRGFNAQARDMAVAVELIHNATLLHDDVIDMADCRRGAPAARTVYGNSASVLAGDWLFVEALQRIRRWEEPGLLERALHTIESMIAAEALQLENRGRLNLDRTDCFRVIDGKTGALFRWAMFAGSTAGGLAADQRSVLQLYGAHLGVTFQIVDDLLDLTGDPAATGKAAFADLREGKMTYPLLRALERDDSLRRDVERLLERTAGEPLPAPLCSELLWSLVANGIADECRDLARKRADEAIECLALLPEGPGRSALAALAAATAERER